jgi:hypothetical protein
MGFTAVHRPLILKWRVCKYFYALVTKTAPPISFPNECFSVYLAENEIGPFLQAASRRVLTSRICAYTFHAEILTPWRLGALPGEMRQYGKRAGIFAIRYSIRFSLASHFAFLAVFAVPVHLFPYLDNSCSRLSSKIFRHIGCNPGPKVCIFTVSEPRPSVPLHLLHAFHLFIFFARHNIARKY